MRVGYVLKKFPRLSETFVLNEILELERQGVDVTVLSLHRPDDGRFHEKLARLRGSVVYVPARTGLDLRAQLTAHSNTLRARGQALANELADLLPEPDQDPWATLRWGFEVAQAVRVRGLDRLHAHFASVATRVARVAHLLTDVPYSFTSHAKDIYRDTVEPAAYARLLSTADFAVTVCDANRHYIVDRLAGPYADKVRRLYNGIELAEFAATSDAVREPGLIVGVGRLIEKKGFGYLVDAVADLLRKGENVRCAIVGDGEDSVALEKKVQALGTDKITLLGPRSHHEVRALLRRASVFALPCVIGGDGNRDALPTVLLEAMAAGVPVVTTPVVGNAEIVDGGRAGVLVPERDAAALAVALRTLLHDAPRRAALAQAGGRRVRELFDLAQNVATLRAWFGAPTPVEAST